MDLGRTLEIAFGIAISVLILWAGVFAATRVQVWYKSRTPENWERYFRVAGVAGAAVLAALALWGVTLAIAEQRDKDRLAELQRTHPGVEVIFAAPENLGGRWTKRDDEMFKNIGVTSTEGQKARRGINAYIAESKNIPYKDVESQHGMYRRILSRNLGGTGDESDEQVFNKLLSLYRRDPDAFTEFTSSWKYQEEGGKSDSTTDWEMLWSEASRKMDEEKRVQVRRATAVTK